MTGLLLLETGPHNNNMLLSIAIWARPGPTKETSYFPTKLPRSSNIHNFMCMVETTAAVNGTGNSAGWWTNRAVFLNRSSPPQSDGPKSQKYRVLFHRKPICWVPRQNWALCTSFRRFPCNFEISDAKHVINWYSRITLPPVRHLGQTNGG